MIEVPTQLHDIILHDDECNNAFVIARVFLLQIESQLHYGANPPILPSRLCVLTRWNGKVIF